MKQKWRRNKKQKKKGTVPFSQEAGHKPAQRKCRGAGCRGAEEAVNSLLVKEGNTESLSLRWKELGLLRPPAHANRIAEVEPPLITSLRRTAHFQLPVPKSKHPAPFALLKPRLTCAYGSGDQDGACARA